jgi:hypothetical protein
MNTILEEILNQTYTLQQYRSRVRLLREKLVSQFFGNKELSYDELVGHSLKENIEWLNALSPEFLNQFNKDNVYQVFKDLEVEVEKIQTMVLYVAVGLPEKETDEIGAFLRKLTGKLLLVDIKVDPSLLAGCAFVWNGIYKDYSLRKKIEENRNEILAQFRTFLK